MCRQGYTEHVGTKTGGLWVKPHYRDRKEDGDQKPTKCALLPRPPPPLPPTRYGNSAGTVTRALRIRTCLTGQGSGIDETGAGPQ